MAAPPPDPVGKYARDVLAGRIVAGNLVRAACQRHLDDVRDGGKRGLVWDRESAERAIAFFGFLRLPTGEPFDLQPSQQFIVGSLFGWKLTDGSRRFRTAYIEEAKGNGKTPLAAGIGIIGMVADGHPAAEVYTAGVTRDQAQYLWADAAKMVTASPALSSRVEVGAHNLAVTATHSYMRPVSSEARSLDQKRVHMALLDEIHEHRSGAVVDKMRAGTKGDPDALIVEITNSGYDRNSVCWQHHAYSMGVLDGTTPNDAWFGYIAALDPGDDWTDEAVWPKANPLLGITVTHRYLREQVREALDMPAKQSLVRRLNFCEWTEASVGAIEMARWDVGAIDTRIPLGASVTGGLDLASTTDITALLLLYQAADGFTDVLAKFWVPEEGIAIRSRRDHVPYDVWVREGWISATPGNVTDYERVREDIRDLAELYQIREIAYDPWNATHLVTQLMADGARCIPVRQGFASLSAPTKEWLSDIAAGRLRHGGNPVLRWMAANLVVEQDAAGNQKPTKDKSTERIDGQVAAIMAKARMILPAEPAARSRMLVTF